MLSIFTVFWGWTSGTHACKSSTLLTELSHHSGLFCFVFNLKNQLWDSPFRRGKPMMQEGRKNQLIHTFIHCGKILRIIYTRTVGLVNKDSPSWFCEENTCWSADLAVKTWESPELIPSTVSVRGWLRPSNVGEAGNRNCLWREESNFLVETHLFTNAQSSSSLRCVVEASQFDSVCFFTNVQKHLERFRRNQIILF